MYVAIHTTLKEIKVYSKVSHRNPFRQEMVLCLEHGSQARIRPRKAFIIDGFTIDKPSRPPAVSAYGHYCMVTVGQYCNIHFSGAARGDEHYICLL